MSDTRQRFLREIAQRVDPEQVVEVHLFQPMRHAGRETGVAVVAVNPAAQAPDVDGAGGGEDGVNSYHVDTNGHQTVASGSEDALEPDALQGSEAVMEQEDGGSGDGPAGSEDVAAGNEEHAAGASEASRRVASRLTVYRAQYRHTLKGPDRGKWELELVAEADAPLLAVDDVVRGVHRRAGEEVEPERLNGEGFRAALREVRWSASAR